MTVAHVLKSAGLALALMASPAFAFHQGETFQVKLKTAAVHGSYSKKACSVQVNSRSSRKQRVSFAIYWQPGRGLWLLTTHKGYGSAKGKQMVEFIFPNGKGLRFPMKHQGAQVQANIGFSSNAQLLHRLIDVSAEMTINLLGVSDHVTINLAEKRKVAAAMKKCRDFLH